MLKLQSTRFTKQLLLDNNLTTCSAKAIPIKVSFPIVLSLANVGQSVGRSVGRSGKIKQKGGKRY